MMMMKSLVQASVVASTVSAERSLSLTYAHGFLRFKIDFLTFF